MPPIRRASRSRCTNHPGASNGWRSTAPARASWPTSPTALRTQWPSATSMPGCWAGRTPRGGSMTVGRCRTPARWPESGAATLTRRPFRCGRWQTSTRPSHESVKPAEPYWRSRRSSHTGCRPSAPTTKARRSISASSRPTRSHHRTNIKPEKRFPLCPRPLRSSRIEFADRASPEYFGNRHRSSNFRARLHNLAGHTAADDAGHRAIALVEGEKLTAVVFDDVHGVSGDGLTQALDLDVVLIAPEIRDDDIGGGVLAEHRGHDSTSLLGDVAPMLHAHLVSLGVAPGCDIAESPHVGRAGPPGGVAAH